MDEEKMMQLAFDQAREALSADEVPVGCVIVDCRTNEIMAVGRNEVNVTRNATRHAEMVAVDRIENKDDLRYACVFTTLEPCIMCASALVEQLHVRRFVFGASNERFGGLGSVLNVPNDVPEEVTITRGVRSEEAIDLLRQFYATDNPKTSSLKTD